MAHLTPAQVLRLNEALKRLAHAPHGGRSAVVAAAAADLGVSVQTVQRWMTEHMGRDAGRKRRTDAGTTAASAADLRTISAALLGSYRKNGNRILGFDDAVEILRVNGAITTQLSTKRLAKLMTQEGLHPDQITRPEPAVEQRSLHPNHVWQVDASVCVGYYLSNIVGLQVMDEEVFYKNKPANLTRIQSERLIRYALADHTSHSVLTRYYLGSECALHLTDFLIWAFGPKEGHVMHGVPFIAQMDMGSANTSAPTLNLLKRLHVRVIVHERHNSRANGSVEKAHHIVETHFESALRMSKVADLDDLNAKALRWSNWFGATKKHRRFNDTRHNCWLRITPEQLRLAPAEELMRELVTTHPETRTVTNNLRIPFVPVKGQGSREYKLDYVPGIQQGMKVEVVVNPFRVPSIDVAYTDAETGEICWMTVDPIARNELGFAVDAPVIGEDLRSAKRSVVDRNRDEVLKLAYGGVSREAAELAKEKGALVFGGTVDPFKPAEDAYLPTYLPKRGTELVTEQRVVEVRRLNTVEACTRLQAALGEHYSPREVYAWIDAKFGAEGVPEDQIDQLVLQFTPRTAPAPQQGGLRAVGDNT